MKLISKLAKLASAVVGLARGAHPPTSHCPKPGDACVSDPEWQKWSSAMLTGLQSPENTTHTGAHSRTVWAYLAKEQSGEHSEHVSSLGGIAKARAASLGMPITNELAEVIAAFSLGRVAVAVMLVHACLREYHGSYRIGILTLAVASVKVFPHGGPSDGFADMMWACQKREGDPNGNLLDRWGT